MVQSAEPKRTMLDTGVPNLDLVLGGGLQRHNSYIIAGASGTGKSVLSEQIVFHRAKQGDRVLLITGLDEPHPNLLEHMRSLRFADPSLIGPVIETVSIVPFLELSVAEKIDVLRRTVLNARPQLVTLDGLRSFEAFAGGDQGLYQFLYGLTSWFAVEGITLILTRTMSPTGLPECPEFSLVDGILLLERREVDGHDFYNLWVRKMRGQKPLGGLHTYTIDHDGVTVWPRPQATFHAQDVAWSSTRLPFGVPTVDALLGGGLPEASSTLLVGDPGAGKAALALAFLQGGAARGEPGIWLGFRESPSRLIEMSASWSGDLAKARDRGQVRFLPLAPFEQEPDRLSGLLRASIDEVGARRLVLDGAEVLDGAFPTARDAASFIAWLVGFLPQEGITALVTRQIPPHPGAEFDPSGVPLSHLFDNVLLVRQVWRRGALRPAIAAVKMGAAGYDATVRELTADERGITVGEPLSAEEEVRQPVPRASGEPVRGPA